VAAALLVLVGGSIALAGSALDPGPDGLTAPTTTTPPLAAPTLLPPAASVTRADTIDLGVVSPAGLRDDRAYRVRIFVNGDLERELRLPDESPFEVPDLPLSEGDNAFRAALVGSGGQSELSAPVSVIRDTTAPVIRVLSPRRSELVYAANEILRGRTEPGATLSVTDGKHSDEISASVADDGRFEATLSLEVGTNRLVLRSVDRAGNQASARITIERGESQARVALTISASELTAAELPFDLEMVATVVDELGTPAHYAQVTFSLSPPNAATMTYVTSSAGGLATWPSVEVAGGGEAVGAWLVTVLAVLPSGTELREDESFSVR